jgi:hypothetical protein
MEAKKREEQNRKATSEREDVALLREKLNSQAFLTSGIGR